MATASLKPRTSAPVVRVQAGRHLYLWIALWVIFQVSRVVIVNRTLDAKLLIGAMVFGILLGLVGGMLGQPRAAKRSGSKLVIYWSCFWAGMLFVYFMAMLAFFYAVTLFMGATQHNVAQTVIRVALTSALSGAVVGLIGGIIRSNRFATSRS